MSVTIPLRSDLPHYAFQCELENVTYSFEVLWNPQSASWMLSISTADDQPIVMGMPIVIDWEWAGRYVDPRLPPGVFMAQDTSGQGLDAGRDDLGSRVILLYFTAAEVAAL